MVWMIDLLSLKHSRVFYSNKFIMANIQNLFIIKAEDGSIVNSLQPYDLSAIVDGVEVPKIVTGTYIVENSGVYTEYSYPAKGSKYATKVTNPSNDLTAYLDEKTGEVSDLLASSCAACDTSTNPSQPVEIISSCASPVFVKMCDPVDSGQQLIFTTSVPICVDNGDGSFSTWLTRERIVWDNINSVVISRVPEFSQDGVTWITDAPASFVYGACIDPQVIDCEITEAFGDDLSTLKPGNNFSITKPSCCVVKVTTNIGPFTLVEGIQHYSTSDFTCLVTIDSVEVISGGCTLDKIHIISNKIQ
jgi:hypothetical protein